MTNKSSKIKSYLAGLGLASVIIIPFGSFQIFFVYEDVQIRFIIIPLTVMLIFSALLGTIFWMRRDLKFQGDLFKAIADFALEFSYVRSNNGSFVYVSPAALDITGYNSEDFFNNPGLMDTLIHPEDTGMWNRIKKEISEKNVSLVKDLRIITRDENTRWIRYHAGPVLDEKRNVTGIRATSIDITLQKKNEKEIQNLADYDVLTGLPNRRLIHKYLTEQIKQSSLNKNDFALVFMDLDRFKFVNDAHGHTMGDILLGQLSRRLKNVCEKNCSHIGRFGGDEFVVILNPELSEEEIRLRCNELIEASNEPFVCDGMRFSLGASLGVTMYPHDGEDAESLIKNADAAMYHAKRYSEDKTHFFSAEIGKTVSETFHYESHLNEAIKENKIDVHYQPIIDLRTGRITAVEALARWKHSDGTSIPPSSFIPLAEDMGRIHILDTRIAEKACMQLRKWLDSGINIKMSLNVSARRFQHSDFCRDMFRITSECGIDPSHLKIELTESALIENIESSREKIKIMRDVHAEVAIDDFGTGFSSLGYLTNLPINVLKIDRSFISIITLGKRNQAIVQGILNLAKSLEISVIAEGIETMEQRLLLQEMECESGQGYLFGKAMSAEDFEKFFIETMNSTGKFSNFQI